MEKKVLEIANLLKDAFGDDIISISLHGSVAQEDTHEKSDIDYFIVFNEIKINALHKLKKIKEKLEKKYNIELSLNIQKKKELPKYRKNAFYHKNRYALFLHESKKIDKTLIGEDPYETDILPTNDEIKLEAIRLINSFAYFLRKFIVNSNSDFAIHEAIRYVIMSSQYANACCGDFPLSTRESINHFSKNFDNFKLKDLPKKLYKYKRGETRIENKDLILEDALNFLEGLDEYVFLNFN